MHFLSVYCTSTSLFPKDFLIKQHRLSEAEGIFIAVSYPTVLDLGDIDTHHAYDIMGILDIWEGAKRRRAALYNINNGVACG